MGEGFKRRHAKQFRHGQDAAHKQELRTPNLFSNRPETLSTVYGCWPTDPKRVLNPEVPFFAKYNEASNGVDVFQGGHKVGHVEHGLDIILAALRDDNRCGGFMRVALQRQSALNGHFDIRCIEGDAPSST